MIPITMSPAMLSTIRSAASDMFFLHRAVLLARRGIQDNGTNGRYQTSDEKIRYLEMWCIARAGKKHPTLGM